MYIQACNYEVWVADRRELEPCTDRRRGEMRTTRETRESGVTGWATRTASRGPAAAAGAAVLESYLALLRPLQHRLR